jgi:hypothetical protein
MPTLKGRKYKVPKFLGDINYDKTIILDNTSSWVINQRENISFSVEDGFIKSSTDNSNTFPNSIAFADANKIQTCHISQNGNALFQTSDNKLYLVDYLCTSITEKTVTGLSIHTPSNASYPGRYFYTHKYMTPQAIDVYCWINYCNVNGGAAPINIFYTTDNFNTIKIAFSFGQNGHYKDNGTASGGSTGTDLGDSGSTIITRHGHSVEYNPNTGKWLCVTGDSSKSFPTVKEIQWVEGVYTEETDSWVWTALDFGFTLEQNTRYKVGEGFFYGGYYYYCTDITSATNMDEGGIWRVPDSSLNNSASHQKLITVRTIKETISGIKLDPNTNNIIFTLADYGDSPVSIKYIGVAKNLGLGKVGYYKIDGADFIRPSSINNDGFFRFDYDKFETLHGRNHFIKVGEDLFENS